MKVFTVMIAGNGLQFVSSIFNSLEPAFECRDNMKKLGLDSWIEEYIVQEKNISKRETDNVLSDFKYEQSGQDVPINPEPSNLIESEEEYDERVFGRPS